jgi:hypothetical protein
MKRIAAFMLVMGLSVAGAMPAQARSTTVEDTAQSYEEGIEGAAEGAKGEPSSHVIGPRIGLIWRSGHRAI